MLAHARIAILQGVVSARLARTERGAYLQLLTASPTQCSRHSAHPKDGWRDRAWRVLVVGWCRRRGMREVQLGHQPAYSAHEVKILLREGAALERSSCSKA